MMVRRYRHSILQACPDKRFLQGGYHFVAIPGKINTSRNRGTIFISFGAMHTDTLIWHYCLSVDFERHRSAGCVDGCFYAILHDSLVFYVSVFIQSRCSLPIEIARSIVR